MHSTADAEPQHASHVVLYKDTFFGDTFVGPMRLPSSTDVVLNATVNYIPVGEFAHKGVVLLRYVEPAQGSAGPLLPAPAVQWIAPGTGSGVDHGQGMCPALPGAGPSSLAWRMVPSHACCTGTVWQVWAKRRYPAWRPASNGGGSRAVLLGWNLRAAGAGECV
jgi:hypothetical protein